LSIDKQDRYELGPGVRARGQHHCAQDCETRNNNQFSHGIPRSNFGAPILNQILDAKEEEVPTLFAQADVGNALAKQLSRFLHKKKSRPSSRDSFQIYRIQLGSAALADVIVLFVLALAALFLLVLLAGLLATLLALTGLAALLSRLTRLSTLLSRLSTLTTLLSVLLHIVCHE
jgi:hypothetical protein